MVGSLLAVGYLAGALLRIPAALTQALPAWEQAAAQTQVPAVVEILRLHCRQKATTASIWPVVGLPRAAAHVTPRDFVSPLYSDPILAPRSPEATPSSQRDPPATAHH